MHFPFHKGQRSNKREKKACIQIILIEIIAYKNVARKITGAL